MLKVLVANGPRDRRMTVYTRKQLEARMALLESLPLGSEIEIQYTVTHEPGGEKETRDDPDPS